MRIYYDPSCLIALYCTEPFSPSVRGFVSEQDEILFINELQELEFKNGFRQKVLRKEISESELARGFRLFDDEFVAGKLERKAINWSAVYSRAEIVSRRLSTKQICRSFDLLHVAIAVASGLKHFASLDHDQCKLARSAGLKVMEFQAPE